LQRIRARLRHALCVTQEYTRLGQPEVGVGVNPGGGGTERLPLLLGRGRALEIILSANDFDGGTTERHGYVNRALPDAELDDLIPRATLPVGMPPR
jgi:enoyl-CoA hydratase/carnithine racemase